MIGDFASINIDETFKCLNSSVMINLVSASIDFQQSCFMECWKGSGKMTEKCIAEGNANVDPNVINTDSMIQRMIIKKWMMHLLYFFGLWVDL